MSCGSLVEPMGIEAESERREEGVIDEGTATLIGLRRSHRG